MKKPLLPLPTVVVLASGRGERFLAAGGTSHKLDAMLDGASVLSRTLNAVRASGLPWHLERAVHAGMGDSLAAAVQATVPKASGWLILPGDMPLIEPQSLREVATALQSMNASAEAAVVPTVGGEQGHPVAFTAACGKSLMALSGDVGARGLLQALRSQGQVRQIALEDEGAILDVDTPEDLCRAEQIWRARQREPR